MKADRVRKPKMAFVDNSNFHDWPMGGMLEYELAILQHLVNDFEVDLWGVSVNGDKPEPLQIKGRKYPVRVYTNVVTGKRIIPNYYRGLELWFAKKAFFDRYDVVYAHTGSCVVALSRIINRTRTTLVCHQHGLSYLTDYSLMSLIQRPLMALARRAADLLFIVSDPDSVREYAKTQENWTGARIVAVSSPIDLRKFNEDIIRTRISERKNKRSHKFVYTGRLAPEKNIHTAINAFARFVSHVNPEAQFYIFGSGKEEEILKKQIEHYGLQNNVFVMGSVPHEKLYPYLEDADMFLIASKGEGVSVSVLEAYASGLPVVCFKVRGLEGQIRDHETGVFAEEYNSKGFYRAMLEAEKNRTRLAYNCLEEAKKYDSKVVVGFISDEIKRAMSIKGIKGHRAR